LHRPESGLFHGSSEGHPPFKLVSYVPGHQASFQLGLLDFLYR
jgi:hypothetical protein